MKEVIDKLFEPCYHYKLGTYRGKHILENYLKITNFKPSASGSENLNLK